MDADGSAAGLSLKEYENCLPPMTGVLGHSLSIPAPDFKTCRVRYETTWSDVLVLPPTFHDQPRNQHTLLPYIFGFNDSHAAIAASVEKRVEDRKG